MLNEFKKFAMRGNVLDMAIGVIIGGAFGKIVSSFVSDIIMPPLGLLTGSVDFSDKMLVLKQATDIDPAITLNWGMFLTTILDFLIIAFAIFLLVRQINRFSEKKEEAPKGPSQEVQLLTEIRDALRK